MSSFVQQVKTSLPSDGRLFRFASDALWNYRFTKSWAITKLRGGAIVRAYLRSAAIPSLQIGCGPHPLPGWLNADVWVRSPSVVYLDATKRFPFPSGSFDFCFSEQMIEHVSVAGARHMLAECLRILKPGGKLRIVTPSLSKVFAIWTADRSPLAQRYVDFMLDHNTGRIGDSTAPVVNFLMRAHGHKFIYDEAAMTDMLLSAGFGSIRLCEINESDEPRLRGLEQHAAAGTYPDPAFYALDSMAIEAVKPG